MAYEIPWSPPDISPGAAMVIAVNNANRQAKRADDYLAMERDAVTARAERESAALARQKEQDKFARDVKAFEAMPELMRRARKSPGAANANPFGMQFEEGQDLPADVEGPEPSPAAEAARFMVNPKAGQAATPELAAPAHERPADALPYNVEGPAETPEGEAERFNTDELMDRAQEGVQAFDPMTLAAANSQGTPLEPKKRLFMTYQGQRSEVPEQNDTLGLGEEYDTMYRSILASGEDEDAARKYVLSEHKSDRTQKAIDARTQSQIDASNTRHGEQRALMEDLASKYRLTFEQRKELARILNQGRMAAAGATTDPAIAEVLRSVEAGAPLSETAEIAAKKKISSKAYTPLAGAVVRNATAANTAQNQLAGLEVTDSKGNVLGSAHNTTQANQLKKQTDQFAQARVRLVELIEDIERQGSRVLTPEDIQQRLSKAESVNAAMRVYNGLGATDASQALEARITGAIGTPGHGFLMGANAEIIKRILHEAEMQHDSRVKTALRSGGGPKLAPVLGGPKGGGGGAEMVTIRNKKTGETKQVTREEAQRMGAL